MKDRTEITVYRPNQRHDMSFFGVWLEMIKNIIRSRELIRQLFKRDFFAEYKKSFLGVGWIIITPIMGIISWVFMQMTGLLNPGDVGIPYPAYILIGTSMWGFFLGFYSSASQTLSTGAGLIMQVNYPHEVLFIKQVAQHLANFTITFGVNIIVLISFGIIPSWKIIFFPAVILPMFFLGAAIGLIVSMISIVAVDISNIIDKFMGLLMFITPIIYSSNVDSALIQTIIKWNPLTHIVCSARDIVIYGRLYDTTGYFLSAIGSLIVFVISWRLFYVSENKVVERMI